MLGEGREASRGQVPRGPRPSAPSSDAGPLHTQSGSEDAPHLRPSRLKRWWSHWADSSKGGKGHKGQGKGGKDQVKGNGKEGKGKEGKGGKGQGKGGKCNKGKSGRVDPESTDFWGGRDSILHCVMERYEAGLRDGTVTIEATQSLESDRPPDGSSAWQLRGPSAGS